jgi:hypothetical protein
VGAGLNCPLYDLVFSDVTGDGVDDIVVAGSNNNISALYTWVRVLRGVGNSTFQAAIETLPSPVARVDLGRLSVGEMTGSGGLDLVFGRSYYMPFSFDTGVMVFAGTGLGTFTQSFVNGFGTTNPQGSAIGDLDGDGIAEAVVSIQSNPVRIFRRGTTAPVLAPTSIPFPATALAISDVNGDGRADVLGVNGSLSVALNQGNLTFLAPISYSGASGDLFVRDWNGDGRVDVATTRSGQIGIYMGDGTGGFSLGPVFGQSTARLAIGDFNGDRKTDFASTGPGVVHVYLAQ